MKDRIDFIIVGAQKSGTTAFADYLREHPDIYVYGSSEAVRSAHFFSDEKHFSRDEVDYATYHQLFSGADDQQLLGECTPVYMYHRDVPRRIWEYNPDIKIIAVLRNPITRAYSHWNMERSRKNENLEFLEALKCERERCREALPFQHRVYSYTDRGYYSEQIRELRRFFPLSNTLFLKSDDLKYAHASTMEKAYSFLGVEPRCRVEPRIVHQRAYEVPMGREAFELLLDLFEPEIHMLENLLGWSCPEWLTYPEQEEA